jgi:hypothetical protein
MLDSEPPLLSKSISLTAFKFARDEGHFCPMRWKLLIITSLVATLFNTSGIYLLVYLMNEYLTSLRGTIGAEVGLLCMLLVVTALACIFVYRHTAQRRKLQAALTAIFSILLTFAALITIAQVLFKRSSGERLVPMTTQRRLI